MGSLRPVARGGLPIRACAAAAAAASLTMSCTTGARSSGASSLKTPSDSVIAYYTAIGRHDATSAARLLAPEIRQSYESSPDSDFNNVVSLTNIRDVKEGVVPPPGVPAGYHDITQVALDYDVMYKQVITEHSGTSSRFVYVGRSAGSARWLILAIGTGP
jgi:hypothetical protein